MDCLFFYNLFGDNELSVRVIQMLHHRSRCFTIMFSHFISRRSVQCCRCVGEINLGLRHACRVCPVFKS